MSNSSGTATTKKALSKGLQTEQRKRRQHKDDKHCSTHKASFATAQKRIKRDFHVTNKMDKDVYTSIGRCMDDVMSAVIDKWNQYTEVNEDAEANKTLTGPIAISAMMSLLTNDGSHGFYHDDALEYINEKMDAYYGVGQTTETTK